MTFDELDKLGPECLTPNFPNEYPKCLKTMVDSETAEALTTKIKAKEKELAAEYRDKLPADQLKRAVNGIFPFIAAYKVLRGEGWSTFDAITMARRMLYQFVSWKQPMYFRMHEAGSSFEKLAEDNVKYMAQDTSLVSTIERQTETEHFFTVHKCLYFTLCTEQGVPEIATIFCDADYVIMGLVRNVKLIRTTTIGRGDACCDFHLFKMD